MTKAIKAYVRYVDRFKHVIGRLTMYMIFAMIADQDHHGHRHHPRALCAS